IGDLIDKGDLGRKECIGGVLGQLRSSPTGKDDRRLVEIERSVKLSHNLFSTFVLDADHNSIRMLEILDRCAFAQELRVGDDYEVRLRARFPDYAFYLVASSNRHRRLGHNNGEASERRGDLARCGGYIAKIGMAVSAARRRADRNEDDVGLSNGSS